MKWRTQIIITVLTFTIVSIGYIVITTPSAIFTLFFNINAFEKSADQIIHSKSATLTEWKSLQYQVPSEISNLGFDDLALDNGHVIFHKVGNALRSYEEYLVYGAPINFKNNGEIKEVPYLKPPFGSEVKDFFTYRKWTYIKIGQE